MTHAERIRETERAFMESAEAFCIVQHNYDVASGVGGWTCGPAHVYDPAAARAVVLRDYEALRTLRAATCPTCGGTGECGYKEGEERAAVYAYGKCPSGCNNGKRRDG